MIRRDRQGGGSLLECGDPTYDEMSSGDHDRLESAIRDHVIGRVADLHRNGNHRISVFEDPIVGTIYIEELIAAILEPDPADFERMYQRLEATDAPMPAICDALINPATNAVGQMWVDDQESFVTVSLASSRLHSLINRLSQHRYGEWKSNQDHNILIGRMPHSTHTLGLATIAACFRERGWNVDGGPDLEFHINALPKLLHEEHRVVGLSVGTDAESEDVSRLIEQLTTYKPRQHLVIGVGGPCAVHQSEMFRSAGADFVATTARDAVFMAETKVSELSN